MGYSMDKINNALLIAQGSLMKKVSVFLFLATFLLSLFFISPIMTGNIIGNMTHGNSNNIGILFFVCSLVCLFFVLELKK